MSFAKCPVDRGYAATCTMGLTSRLWSDTYWNSLECKRRSAPAIAYVLGYRTQSNYSALHSAPVYLNQMNSAMLRMLSGDASLSIGTVMHPFPGTVLSTVECELSRAAYHAGMAGLCAWPLSSSHCRRQTWISS